MIPGRRGRRSNCSARDLSRPSRRSSPSRRPMSERPGSAISVFSVPTIATRYGEAPRNGSRRANSAGVPSPPGGRRELQPQAAVIMRRCCPTKRSSYPAQAVSSTQRLLEFISTSLEYWVARSSRAMTVESAAWFRSMERNKSVPLIWSNTGKHRLGHFGLGSILATKRSPHQSSIAKSVTSFLAQSIASLSSSQERASQSLKCRSCPTV